MTEQNTNMALWDAVSETDPGHTKSVSQRGGFTAIDAQYQIMRATQQWGPVGGDWAYTVDHEVLWSEGGVALAVADVTVSYMLEGFDIPRSFGPIRGINVLIDAKGRVDDDAPKKALTDALTKALSHLGFSADVFLGLYDDNKYVEGLNAKYNRQAKAPATGGNGKPAAAATVEDF